MSLSQQDLLQIREIVEGVFDRKIEPITAKLEVIEGKLEALENDIKEIYGMISELQHPADDSNGLTIEEKIRRAHKDLLLIAKQAGVSL